MTPDDERLRELAKAATPGPWSASSAPSSSERCPGSCVEVGHNRWFIVDHGKPDENYAVATYIAAASPDRILDLLRRLEEAERENHELRRACGAVLATHAIDAAHGRSKRL